jgi:hypothetical protein
VGKAVDWLTPDDLVQELTRLLAPPFAAAGVVVASLWYAFLGLWCHYAPGLLVLPPFLLAYALLYRSSSSRAVAVGACCWAWPPLCYWRGFQDHAAWIPLDPMGLFYLIVGSAFMGSASALARWLWSLPLPRRSAAGMIGSLALGTTLLVISYWPCVRARFYGRGACLAGANLAHADLRCADLRGANLRNANLRGVSLWGADLSGADLTGADLTDAAYDRETRWPSNYFPESHGALEYEFM